jgi:phytoene dehydrogenase-like protein
VVGYGGQGTRPIASGESLSRYDAIVVGGGHNGMVTAFYLARAGLRVVVLERRPFVGGMAVTEEFAPGYYASTGAYVLAMLRDVIWRDMHLAERGLRVDPTGPSLNLFATGEHLYLHDDPVAMRREVEPLSPTDARAYERFSDELEELAGWFGPLFSVTPFDPRIRGLADLERLARVGVPAIRHRKQLLAAAHLFAASCAQYLDERFANDVVKGTLSWFAINDSVSGPSTPGSAYVLLHEFASSEAGGGVRKWGFVRGGIGRVSELMAEATRDAGAEIRTDSPVAHIVVDSGRAAGVVLECGDEIRAPVVVSNADPKRTMLGLVDERELPDDYLDAMRTFICEGTSVKVNLAVGELPRAAWDELNELPGAIQPYHRCIIECNSTVTEMDLNQAQARAGIPAVENPHVELCCPTVFDPSLAPPGKHIVTIDMNSQPYTLREGSRWDDIKEEVADRAIAQIARYFPNLPDAIEHRQVLSPLDMERLWNVTGGHALHGDMGDHQLFFLRPVRGYADYRTPVEGLYLCSAGTHPGGGISGVNGTNCAREVLRDRRRRRKRS